MVLGVHGKDLNQALPYMLSKVMIAYVDVLGKLTESWESGKFKCARVIFKDFAIHVGLCIDYVKFTLPHFLDKCREWNDVTKGH